MGREFRTAFGSRETLSHQLIGCLDRTGPWWDWGCHVKISSVSGFGPLCDGLESPFFPQPHCPLPHIVLHKHCPPGSCKRRKGIGAVCICLEQRTESRVESEVWACKGTQGHFLWWGVNLSGSKGGISNQWWWILRQCHSCPCVVSSQPYSFWARQPAGGFVWTASFSLPWCRIAVIDLFATTSLPLAWGSQSWRESEPDLSHYHSVLSPCSWINSPLLP